jgi:hypothetical protein
VVLVSCRDAHATPSATTFLGSFLFIYDLIGAEGKGGNSKVLHFEVRVWKAGPNFQFIPSTMSQLLFSLEVVCIYRAAFLLHWLRRIYTVSNLYC